MIVESPKEQKMNPSDMPEFVPPKASERFMENSVLATQSAGYRAKRVLIREGGVSRKIGVLAFESSFEERLLAVLTPEELSQEPIYQRLVERNLGLVPTFVGKFVRRFNIEGIPIEDLIQEGNIALMRAVDKFDPEREVNLSVYARDWIEQALQRFSGRFKSMISVPYGIREEASKLARRREGKAHLPVKDQMDPGPVKTRYREKLINQALSIDTVFLSEPTNIEDRTIGDAISYDDEPTVEDQAVKNMLIEILQDKLELLEPKLREILGYRFGLNGLPQKPLRELGKMRGATAPTMERMEKKALKALRGLMGVDQSLV
jgi:RNA polymerase sigma factor (sigma-70 family)